MVSSARHAPISETRDYLLDMIVELAKLARLNGEMPVAIHLEAIVCAEQIRKGQRHAN